MEDATYTLLQDFVDSLSNLSSEVGHLLCEIAYLDYAKQPSKDDQPPVSQAGNGESGSNKKWYSVDESLRKAASKQSAIVRYSHKAPNSLLTLNPREPLLVERALAHYEDAIKLSKEKEKFATRAVSLVSRHLDCLNLELVKLEATTGIDVPEFNRDASETVTVPPGPSGNALASTSGNSCTPAPDLASSRIKRKHSAMETPSPLGLSYTLPIVSPTGTPTAANKRRLTSSRQTIRARAGSANVHTDHKPPAPIVGDRVEVEADEGDVSNGGDDTTLYCFCQKVSYGEMIGCDNKTCQYEWFHVPCVGLKETPFGNWYCPQCTAEGKGEKFLQTGRHRKRA